MNISMTNINYIYYQENATLASDQNISILKDISLKVKSQSINLVLGPSGAGKTTVFDIISLNKNPTTGNIKYNDLNVLEYDNDLKQKFKWNKIGYLNQNLSKNYIGNFSLIENINLLKMNVHEHEHEHEHEDIEKTLISDLENLGLNESHLHTPLNKLSGGEKQRISLILIKYRDPAIWLLDEPTSFLDNDNKIRIIDLIKQLKKEKKTLLIATHDFNFIGIADEIFLLLDGKIHEKNVLHIISELMYEKLRFKKIQSSNEGEIIIPNHIFKNMKNNIYLLTLNQGQTIMSFKRVTDQGDIKKQNFDSILVINESKFILPEKMRDLDWRNYYWEINSKIVKIVFT